MTADGDGQPIRHRRRMHSPALRYGENGRSGTRGVGDGLSRRAPRGHIRGGGASIAVPTPGRRWTHGWRGAEDRPRLSTNICRLFGSRRRPRRRSHPSRPPRRSRRRSSPRYSARWAQNSNACPAARMAAASHRTTTPSSSCAVVVVVAARQPPSSSRRRSRRRRTDSSCAFSKRSVVRRAAISPVCVGLVE